MSKFDVTNNFTYNDIDNNPDTKEYIDKYILAVESDYDMILVSIYKVITGIEKNVYHAIELGSKEIIEHLDNFIISSRRLRKELSKIGFYNLRKMKIAIEISNLHVKTEYILKELVYLNNTYYDIIASGVFFKILLSKENK